MSRAKPATQTVYFRAEDLEQLRAAQAAVGLEEGHASISELLEAAALKELRRLQRKYNNGQVWDAPPEGAVRRGQRTRAEVKARDTR